MKDRTITIARNKTETNCRQTYLYKEK